MCEGYRYVKIPSFSERDLNIHRFLIPLRLSGTNPPWIPKVDCCCLLYILLPGPQTTRLKHYEIELNKVESSVEMDASLCEAFLDVSLFLTHTRSSHLFLTHAGSFHQPKHLLSLPSSVSSFDIFFTVQFMELFFFLFETECHTGLKLTTESRMT